MGRRQREAKLRKEQSKQDRAKNALQKRAIQYDNIEDVPNELPQIISYRLVSHQVSQNWGRHTLNFELFQAVSPRDFSSYEILTLFSAGLREDMKRLIEIIKSTIPDLNENAKVQFLVWTKRSDNTQQGVSSYQTKLFSQDATDKLLQTFQRICQSDRTLYISETRIEVMVSNLAPIEIPIPSRQRLVFGASSSNPSKPKAIPRKDIIAITSINNNCFLQCFALHIFFLKEKYFPEPKKVQKEVEGQIIYDVLPVEPELTGEAPDYVKNFPFQRNKLFGTKSKQTHRNKSAEYVANLLNLPVQAVAEEQFQLFENFFQTRIFIYDDKTKKRIYPLTEEEEGKEANELPTAYSNYPHTILLSANGNHIDYINNPNAYFNKYANSSFCYKCGQVYCQGSSCECSPKCKACKRTNCSGVGKTITEKIETLTALSKGLQLPDSIVSTIASFYTTKALNCPNCKNSFPNQECLDNHLKTPNACDISFCSNCSRKFKTKNNHSCYYIWCSKCDIDYHRDTPHYCFTKTIEKIPKSLSPSKENKFIFYDYETIVSEKNHDPFLIVAMYYSNDTPLIFYSNDEFCRWLFQKKHDGFICLAHNAKGYDCHFIRSWIYSNTRNIKIKESIAVGNKFMSFKAGASSYTLTFRDSHLLVSKPLKAFAKCFSLQEGSKGYFPYTFITRENLHTTLPSFPPIQYFGISHLKDEKEIQDLQDYYNANKDQPFPVLEKAIEYCVQDVSILKQGLIKFRQQFLQIHPEMDILKFITLPQATMTLFRSKFLKPKLLHIIPDDSDRNSSKLEKEWFSQLRETNPNIHKPTAKTCGQLFYNPATQRAYEPDGYDATTKTVYEFHGCYYHGCPSCFPLIENEKKAEQFRKNYERTILREEFLRKQGFTVISMWEHDFISSYSHLSKHLSIKDSYFGGRTEPIRIFATDIQADYYDFTSLYPSVMFGVSYGITKDTFWQSNPLPLPIGAPTIPKIEIPLHQDILHLGDEFQKHFENCIQNRVGFVCLQILPPYNLFHPVLPVRIEVEKTQKLMFPLCYSCAKFSNSSKYCSHSIDDRSITGTYAIPELLKAIEKGYKVVKIFDIVLFPYAEQNQDLACSVFKEYIQEFYKLKTYADKMPENLEEYIQINKRYGIHLDPSKMGQNNPTAKETSKLCLNALYGKWAQNSQKTHIKEFLKGEEASLQSYQNNPLFFDKTEIPINENATLFTYKIIREELKNSNFVNIAIASYITAYARLRLYSALELAGENALYTDTDSIIFIKTPDAPITGERLGDFKNELSPTEFMTEFFSSGPKSYHYKTSKDNTVLKIKGVALTQEAKEELTPENFKKLISGELPIIKAKQLQFRINKASQISSSLDSFTKAVKMTFDKRVVDFQTGITYPFGYLQQKSKL